MRAGRWLILSILVLGALQSPVLAQWKKYVHPDGSFSFHYPAGWTVSSNESLIVINEKKSDQEILIIALPNDEKTPRQTVDWMTGLLKEDNPDLKVFDFKEVRDDGGGVVRFELSYSQNGGPYLGHGVMIHDASQRIWFSYSAPSAGYSKDQSAVLLGNILESVASGGSSLPPGQAGGSTADTGGQTMDAGQMKRNADAFVFMLEFALGAPLTQAQEQAVLDELLSGWRQTPAGELEKYNLYPAYVEAMMGMSQKDLDELRRTLETTTREWLDTSDASDPAVRLIRNHLSMKGKVLVPGEPPLTIMAADAYAEFAAYADLLAQDITALPGQITSEKTALIRRDLVTVWNKLSVEDREKIATTPGVWLVLRRIVQYGSMENRNKARRTIADAFQSSGSSASGQPARTSGSGRQSSGGKASADLTGNFIKHQAMMQIQNTTFNTYMWSRGFNYSPAFGKMW